ENTILVTVIPSPAIMEDDDDAEDVNEVLLAALVITGVLCNDVAVGLVLEVSLLLLLLLLKFAVLELGEDVNIPPLLFALQNKLLKLSHNKFKDFKIS
ncbi:13069_t:CDS:2, partial [Entrophospora sp. SA101]